MSFNFFLSPFFNEKLSQYFWGSLVHGKFLFSCLLSLDFNNFTVVCFGVDLFQFIILGDYLVSWICIFMPFFVFGRYLAITSSNIFSHVFFLSFLAGTPTMSMFCIWWCTLCPSGTANFSLFFFFFFWLLRLYKFNYLIFKFIDLKFHLFKYAIQTRQFKSLQWVLKFKVSIFQLWNFSFLKNNSFYIPIEIFILFTCYFPNFL